MTNTGEELDLAVAAAAQGDRSALAQVLELIRPLVVRYCRARIGAAERGQLSADDVAQEVCLAVMTALPRYQDQGRPFMAFVYGIASHKVADAHRNAARNKAEAMAEVPDVISTDQGPEQRALESETSRQMNRLLATLPEKHREILILRLVMGLSAEETAVAVGSTAGAIRVAQHRALAKLKSQVARAGEMYG
ncbi:sigma-70 family RNA polymerase sigma factor [Nocardia takedensis]|uniref:Sigma-70 family RNA polymerase sigma factor n=1 Tax=Nocardia bovistercoris TaxID=2785916 RepID=A0A931IBF9_9NOCA|nr:MULTISPECIES: sigma-70 family RNA polymerase sigma factor [Nocardia]MBH0777511.1 sigma-70 family RNA polymerase sigma factor [Nocardia bovistercoris]